MIGWRRGSVPEVVQDGVSGYIVDSIEEATRAVTGAAQISRQTCRQEFERRFDARRMAADYENLYRQALVG